jgi:hypothetical protein
MKCFRFACLAAVAAAACLALTACGGSSSSNTAGTGAAATASSSATSPSSLAAFQSCLKSHGVTIRPGAFGSGTPRPFPTGSPRPRPTGSFTRRPGAGFSGGADSTAFKDCAKYAPAGFSGGFGGFGGGGFRGVSASALAAFKSCMSQNGVKVTGTTAQQILSSLRNATGKTATADKTCRVLLQPAGGAPTPSPSS